MKVGGTPQLRAEYVLGHFALSHLGWGSLLYLLLATLSNDLSHEVGVLVAEAVGDHYHAVCVQSSCSA